VDGARGGGLSGAGQIRPPIFPAAGVWWRVVVVAAVWWLRRPQCGLVAALAWGRRADGALDFFYFFYQNVCRAS
jgi:hypothetical protein